MRLVKIAPTCWVNPRDVITVEAAEDGVRIMARGDISLTIAASNLEESIGRAQEIVRRLNE